MKIHLIGIGGIGVSALAQYYLTKGQQVSGSDLVSSEITEALKKKGAKIFIGRHKTKNLPKDIDSVIYSPAVKVDNPELKVARKKGIRYLSYPEALGELTKQHYTIAVSGTHGKSTTSAMIGLLLVKAGLDPTVIVGTKVKEFGNSNCRVGKSKFLVIEADEHLASFLNYWPKIIVLTNVERDHLDFYKNLKNILKTFREYVGHLPENGILVANGDDSCIQRMLSSKPDSKFKIQNYSLKQKEAKKLKKILKVSGEHNVSNALAALTAARALKIPDRVSFKALSEYKGSWRRFEISHAELDGTKNGATRKITVVSDYGHHPTEIAATCKAAREKWPNKIIWLVFQPHQYQRTFYLFKNFVNVFRKAVSRGWINLAIVTDIYDVAGREEKKIKKRMSAQILANEVKKENVIYLPEEKILRHLRKNLNGGEVVIIMGAGDIYKLVNQF